MAYFVGGIIGLILAGTSGRGGELWFIFSLLVAHIFRLNRRIAAIELSLARAASSQTNSPVKAAVPATDSLAQPDTSLPRFPHVTSPPQSTPASTLAAPTSTPLPAWSIDETSARPFTPPVSEPSPIIEFLKSFFATNAIAKIGVILLFIGVAFLLKLVNDQGLIPIELRLCATAIAAFALIAGGWHLRGRNAKFGLVLQSSGIGIFYLTVFAAFRLYELIPGAIAFALLFAVTAGTAVLAILQDSRTLATFGTLGGFLAPILTSTGQGSHVMLFAYYTLLNTGVLSISWYKAWRPLNLVGFFSTFIISAAWGARYYQPEHFATVEPFLIVFFVTYFAIGIAYALKRSSEKLHAIDGFLILGVPFLTFALQVGMVYRMQYGVALSAAAIGAFYVIVARQLYHRLGAEQRLLIEALLGVGAVLLTVAIPFAFSARQTSAIWAIEGVGILWVGRRQKRWRAQVLGALVELLAGVAYLCHGAHARVGEMTLLNPAYLGILFLTASYTASAYLLTNGDEKKSVATKSAANAFYVVAFGMWILGGLLEIDRLSGRIFAVPGLGVIDSFEYQLSLRLLFYSLTAVMYDFLPVRRAIYPSGRVRLLFVPVLMLELWADGAHPLRGLQAVAWPLAIMTHYALVWRSERRTRNRVYATDHYLVWWLIGAIVGFEVTWASHRFTEPGTIWASANRIYAFAVLVFVALSRSDAWPFGVHKKVYAGIAVIPFVAWLVLVPVFLNLTDSGAAAPLPFVPLLNPLDLAQVVALIAVFYWSALARELSALIAPTRKLVNILLGGVIFIWLTAFPVRILHHYFGIPWRFDDLFASSFVQATLSIFWCFVALGLMQQAVRRVRRPLWIAGITLLGLVVGKLMLVDLANQGTVARVVSFIGTGALLLLVGYIAPMPPEGTARKIGEGAGNERK